MKKSRKVRRYIPILIAFFAIILISAIGVFIYVLSGNYITYVNIDNSANKVNNTTAKDSNIIVMNGIVLGASKNREWISTEKYCKANGYEGNLDVNLYSDVSLYGTFKTASLKTSKNKVVYTTIGKDILPEQYLAVSSNVEKNITNLKKIEATEADKELVKDALGGYAMLNSGINITEIYSVKIKNNSDKLIFVTAEKANLLGVYSAVIYVTSGESYLVKYSYVRDTDNADKWPVYSLKFVHDLNSDQVPEIILEEVTGKNVSYNVFELRNNKFYQVLSTTIDL